MMRLNGLNLVGLAGLMTAKDFSIRGMMPQKKKKII